ncbi:unnamed protein product [Polarella glacialis]|uniref:EndoU domain-containing protein n=1 Tax=Polarella glacialis TaxID=89957 RepID=A0A813DQS5_POLGL|nr:unnamed protein product [Polarella glacialis]
MQNPCSTAFVRLLDNYERETDDDEVVTKQEEQEMERFMQRLMQTPHMRYIHQVLVAWGTASPDARRFAAQVFEIWFSTYSLTGLQSGAKRKSGLRARREGGAPGQLQLPGLHWRADCR